MIKQLCRVGANQPSLVRRLEVMGGGGAERIATLHLTSHKCKNCKNESFESCAAAVLYGRILERGGQDAKFRLKSSFANKMESGFSWNMPFTWPHAHFLTRDDEETTVSKLART